MSPGDYHRSIGWLVSFSQPMGGRNASNFKKTLDELRWREAVVFLLVWGDIHSFRGPHHRWAQVARSYGLYLSLTDPIYEKMEILVGLLADKG